MHRMCVATLIVLLVGACGGSVVSPSPSTESPTPSASATPSAPSATAVPSATPVPETPPSATPSGRSLPSGCGCSSGLSTPDPAFTVLLRITFDGGLPYPGTTVLDPPVFSLYGDGRAVYTEDRITDDKHEVQLWQAQLTPAAVNDLTAYALDTAGLRNARNSYTDGDITDAGTTTFEVHADGVDKVVSVYALGYHGSEGSPSPEASARVGFELLAQQLEAFGAEVRAGGAQDLGSFVPRGYIIVLRAPWAEMAVTAQWPWPDLSPNDFKPVDDRLANWWADPDKGEAVVKLGIEADLVAKAPDGKDYVISVIPLVPSPPDYLRIEQ